jgi:hypothetical protein
MAPKFFEQVLTVAAHYKNKYFIIAYIILPLKEQLTYKTVFGQLKDLL